MDQVSAASIGEIQAQISKLHNVKTLEEIDELYTKFKGGEDDGIKKTKEKLKKDEKTIKLKGKERKNLINIDVSEYTINLLNFYSELRYTANLHERDEELVEYLDTKIKILTPLVKEGLDYNFKNKLDKNGDIKYKITLELYLAYMQTELKGTTLGYPHIHIGIWVESSFNLNMLKLKLYNIMRDFSELNDIDVAESKHQGRPTKTLGYVCKNHSSKVVYDSLKSHDGDTEIVRSIITSVKNYKGLSRIINYISNTGGGNSLTSNKKSKYNKSIAMSISVSEDVYDKYVNPKTPIPSPRKVNTNEIKMVDATLGKRNAYYNYIQSYMIKHNLVIYDNLIYKKIKNSKSSYNYKYTIENFLDNMECIEIYANVSMNVRPKVEKYMRIKLKNKLKDNDEELKMIEFPKIEINYRMIEFRDFYYCLVTRAIYKTQYHYHTYLYCPEVCLENFSSEIERLLRDSIWVHQLKASGIFTTTDITKLGTMVHNRKYIKKGALYIVGLHNTGKTTILKPFINAFPKYKVGYMQSISEHHIYEQMKDKEMVVMNEANSILRSSSTSKGRSDVLLTLEGGQSIANKKMGEIITIDTSKNSITMTGNIEVEDEKFVNNGPLMSRVQMIVTHSDEIFNGVYEELAAKTECPLILLFCGMCSSACIQKVNYIPNPVIYDELEGEQLEFIKKSNIFDSDVDQPERHEDDDILRHSKMNKDGYKLPKTTPFECLEILPINSLITNEDHVNYMKEEIKQLKSLAIMDKFRECEENHINVNIHANVRV